MGSLAPAVLNKWAAARKDLVSGFATCLLFSEVRQRLQRGLGMYANAG